MKKTLAALLLVLTMAAIGTAASAGPGYEPIWPTSRTGAHW